MRKPVKHLVVGAAVAVVFAAVLLVALYRLEARAEDILGLYRADA